MRRSVMSVALTFAVGVVNQAAAQPRPAGAMPAAAKLPSGWTYFGNQLTWTVGKRVPVGDAAVEFFSGAELLGRMVGGYVGGALIRDDYPMPKITLEPIADHVKEGQTLSRRVWASSPTPAGLDFFAPFDGELKIGTITGTVKG